MPDSFVALQKRLRGRKLVIYGIGLIGFEALTIIELIGNMRVDSFADRKADTVNFAFGRTVISKHSLSPKEHYCVIAPPNYFSQIATELNEIGYSKNDDYCSYSELRNSGVVFDGVPLGKHTNGFSAYADCLGHTTKDYIESIGSFCSINKTAFMGADHNFLLSTSHEVFRLNKLGKQRMPGGAAVSANRVSIGSDVWIGANTFINASKVKTIGDGAVIATGAVVIEDVPPYAIVAGVPAKVKKYRFSPEQIDILLRVRWWEWSDDDIASHSDLFYDYSLFFERYKMYGKDK
ncbi:CatB-related O-acetyltransferase [Desulfitobacterium sp. PCE1]|uniref:CatB-related O-acetyltransferase n=1 Tax=Desulfitobacterium sp. PCE1 TaxID=146907 RepID=UPI000363D031|nr:CatB-related O-acetyltransferase [Desulfitobacterium sp. PCE1]